MTIIKEAVAEAVGKVERLVEEVEGLEMSIDLTRNSMVKNNNTKRKASM